MKAHHILLIGLLGLLACVLAIMEDSGPHYVTEAVSSVGPVVLDTDTPIPTETITPFYTPTNTNIPIPTDTPCSIFPTPPVTPTPCSDVSFTDVHPSDYFYAAVRDLYCVRRAISGYADNTFHPYDLVTRAQICKIVVLAMGWPFYCGPIFYSYSDVYPGHPFYWYINTALYRRVIFGYPDNTFRPDNNVLRGQLAKIIVLSVGWTIDCPQTGHFSDVPPDSPYYCCIETAYSHGAISGYVDSTFRSYNWVTRGQASKVTYLAQRYQQTTHK